MFGIKACTFLALLVARSSATPSPGQSSASALIASTVPVPSGAQAGNSIQYCIGNSGSDYGGKCQVEYPITNGGAHCMPVLEDFGKGPAWVYGGIVCNFFSEADCSTGGSKKSYKPMDSEWVVDKISKWDKDWSYKAYACKSPLAGNEIVD